MGVWARSAAGKDLIGGGDFVHLVRALDPEPAADAWFVDEDAGVALLRPEHVGTSQGGARSSLAIRGRLIGGDLPRDPATGALPAGAGGLLRVVARHGPAAFEQVEGEFAIACWDGETRRLWLIRDPLGQRALFVRILTDVAVFCSELEPLLRLTDRGVELDYESALWYLSFGTSCPGRTLARDVQRVRAGHALEWRPGSAPRSCRYFTPLRPGLETQATAASIDELRVLLDRAIALRVSANKGSTGILLSGGVDSTYIARTSCDLGHSPVAAFTAAFDERYGMNETEYAEAVSRWLGLKQQTVMIDAVTALHLLDGLVLARPEPCSAWAAVTHGIITARARQLGVDTLLSGLGADEIFGGYDHFRGYYARWLRSLQSDPPPAGMPHMRWMLSRESQRTRRLLYPGVARFFDDRALREALTPAWRSWHYAPQLRAFYLECLEAKPEAHPMECMIAMECATRIPDLLLSNFDPIARAAGIDMSYPFLSPPLVQRAAALAAEARYRTASGQFSLRLRDLHPRFKHAMLRVATDRVPRDILDRPRKSFTAPFGGWMFHARFRQYVVDRLSRSRFWELGLLRRSWLDHNLEHLVPGPRPEAFQLWAVLTLSAWVDRYLAG
jgi:asparagine synthase (glutamine-hydrolysing)